MVLYEAANAQEAMAMAEGFRAEGRHDFFRGQTQPWPLRSSLQRRDGDDQREAIRWLDRFRAWLSHTDGLWPISADQDQATAVAQHYGLPTDFIDVTPDPRIAAFFALDERAAAATEPCCIICINSTELARGWAARYANYRRPEIITMTVPNLWRLEAQQGAFLFSPYPDVEALWPFDRIYFPPSTLDGALARYEVYPERKSALEILLDQFFQRRAITQFNQEMRTVMTMQTFESPDQRYHADRVKGGTLDTLPSWNPSAVRPWRHVKREAYSAAVGPTELVLSIDSVDASSRAAREAALQVLDRLTAEPDLRQRALRFRVTGLPVQEGLAVATLANRVGQLWDGLRLLPYHDEEIAEGIGRALAIGLEMVARHCSNPDKREAAEMLEALGDRDVLLVEFGQDDASYSRASVAEADLRAIIRADLYDRVTPEFAATIRTDVRALLFGIHAPEKLFEFRPLAHLFATRLAPIQVHTRMDQPVVYSPARLETFGLP